MQGITLSHSLLASCLITVCILIILMELRPLGIINLELGVMEMEVSNHALYNNSSNLDDGGRRTFLAFGRASYLFVEMGAYRAGPRTFFVVGLGSKPLHVFANASFECEWVPTDPNPNSYVVDIGKTEKMLPDWGFGRVYTTLVIGCSFPYDVGTNAKGGQLIFYAFPGIPVDMNKAERFVALQEHPGEYNATKFHPPYPFEYIYCGSPLFGDLNPQRIHEWIAYHAMLFGPRTHFMFYDAGGIQENVREVLDPWIKSGWASVQDVRDQERFDGYYHNQFMILNDCLHRTRFMGNWTFFFDVDEYLYVPQNSSLHSVLEEHSGFTQIRIEQRRMSNQLCLRDRADTQRNLTSRWMFEKLVFQSTKRRVRLDRKYAVQPRNVYATGVHLTENLKGRTKFVPRQALRYYHYHDTVSRRGEICGEYVNKTTSERGVVWYDKTPYRMDRSMVSFAGRAKAFDLQQQIG